MPDLRDDDRPPAFDTDADETRRSMERIEAIAAERGAEIWIQHSSSRRSRAHGT